MNLRLKELVVLGIALAVILVAFVFAFNGSASSYERAMPEKSTASLPASSTPDVSAVAPPAEGSAPDEAVFASGISTVPDFTASELSFLSETGDLPESASGPALARVPAKAPRPAAKNFSCAGQICIDAETGKVLSSRNADKLHPPASVTKLMTIFLVFDAIEEGKLRLSSPVVASKRAQDMGGTQVNLAEGEMNSVDDLLYALMLQSANDVAVALAEKVSGSVETFVEQMNAKARELGLKNTIFYTPHGLSTVKERAAGKKIDMTTAADLAKLSRALLLKHPKIFRYCAAKSKKFRDGKFNAEPMWLTNHNKLLTLFPGCDGLKTGWISAGASIVTTASRGNRRVIAVVLGGIVPSAQKGVPDPKASQRERNQRAAELMFDGLKQLDALKYEPTPQRP